MNESDAELVRQSLSSEAGADEAFGRLIARYRPTIFGLAFAATGHAGEAEDLTQETLIAAYLSLPRLRDPERFGVWLYGIARNLVRMWYRRQAGTPTLDGGHLLEELVDDSQRTPEERVDQQERLRICFGLFSAWHCVATLPLQNGLPPCGATLSTPLSLDFSHMMSLVLALSMTS